MSIFLISDTHFNHANILNLGVGRPFKDINHHNEMLIQNWNSVVTPDDTVIHLGDVSMGAWPDGLMMVKRLNGYKILIPGNHDRISSTQSITRQKNHQHFYEEVFDELWDEVETLTIGGMLFVLSHYPYDGDNADGRKDRHVDLRAVDKGIPLIHGHTHQQSVVTRSKKGTMQISVGVDSNNWRPVSSEQIIETYKWSV